MQWIALAGGIVSLFIGIPVIWKTVIQPGAQRIAESQVTGPILAELAKAQPPITRQLTDIQNDIKHIDERLDRVEQRLR